MHPDTPHTDNAIVPRMPLSRTRAGEVFVGADIVLTALLPVVATLSYGSISSLNSLAWSTLFAAVVFAALVLARGTWRELRDPLVWRYGLFVALFIGVLFYGLYFTALNYTSPGNVAILMLFQVFTSFVFFNLIRSEPFSREYLIGAGLMVAGALIVLGRDWQSPNLGDVLMLAATACTPFGNYYQQRARAIASAETSLLLRSVFSAMALFCLVGVTGTLAPLASVHAALPLLIFNGIAVLVVAKICWVEGIHRVPVTKAIALSAFGPLCTLLFAWLMLGQHPTAWQFAAFAPFALGLLLLTDQLRLRRSS